MKPIRILIVDDSSLVRTLLTRALEEDPGLEVVGTAADPYEARDRILELRPDVMTLDVDMPRMNGIEFLRRLIPQHPLPVVMVSSLTRQGQQATLDALAAGTVDFVAKAESGDPAARGAMLRELRAKLHAAAIARVSPGSERLRSTAVPTAPSGPDVEKYARRVIAIGASTGGTEAIKQIVTRFPAAMPPILVVQHMPTGFTRMFAERLNQLSALTVREAADGDPVLPGQVLVAPGGLQMRLEGSPGALRVRCEALPLVGGHAPSVDVLMNSLARCAAKGSVGLLLTGMGADGAEGMCALRKAGGRTLAQDQATSVVFGMPRVAFERGGVEKLLPLGAIAPAVVEMLKEGAT